MDMDGKQLEIVNQLGPAIQRSLEELAFIEVRNLKTMVRQDDNDAHVCMSLDMKTPFAGRLFTWLPVALIDRIAQLIYEDDAPLAEGALRDMAGEILNTFSGNLLARALDDNQSFAIGFPAEAEPEQFWRAESKLFFSVDDLNGGVAVAFTE